MQLSDVHLLPIWKGDHTLMLESDSFSPPLHEIMECDLGWYICVMTALQQPKDSMTKLKRGRATSDSITFYVDRHLVNQ